MLQRVRLDDGSVHYRSPALDELGVPHAFTTRHGPGGQALDVGELDGLRDVLRCMANATPVPIDDAKQVHGATVSEGADAAHVRPEADALVTHRKRLVLVRTADCVPVLLATSDGVCVAAVHAGWRGLVAGVLPRTLEVLGRKHDPSRMVAAVGPCLSLAHFEVGAEVAHQFEAANLAATIHEQPDARPHIDLRAAATLQLERAGVRQIDLARECTWADSDDFYSYRRDVTHGERARSGSLASLIGPRAVLSPVPANR